MKSNRIVLVSLAVALMLAVVPAYAGTITFSEGGLVAGYGPDPTFPGSPKGTLLTNQLASYGVLFSTANGVAYVSNSTVFGSIPSPLSGNVLGVNTLPLFGSPAAVLTITFVDPTNSAVPGIVQGSGVSLALWDTEASPSPRVVVNTYDLFGAPLETQNLTSASSTLSFSSGWVHTIQVVDAGGDGHALDNLTYGEITAVPEPGTFALLGLGLLGLSAALRRRKL